MSAAGPQLAGVLAPLAGIAGVTGAALFDADDRCLAATLQPPYEQMLVERVMRTLRQALLVLHAGLDCQATWSGLFLRCEGGHLIVKRVGEHTLLVFGQPTVNVAMIAVGLNVAAMKLRSADAPSAVTSPTRVLGQTARIGQGSQPMPAVSDGGFQDPRAALTVGYAAASISPAALLTPSHGGATPSSVPPVGSGPLPAWTGAAEGSPGTAHGASAAGLLPRASLELVLRALAKYLGPAARDVLRDELVALGAPPQAVPLSSYSDLIDQVARHIQEPSRRAAFVIEAELVGIHVR